MLKELFAIIEDRKRNPQEGSYTAYLLAQGGETIAKKVNEEALEVILAAREESDQRVIAEAADLLYHLFVLLAWRDLNLEQVEAELRRRHRES